MKIRLQPRRQHAQYRVPMESCAVVLAIAVCLLLSSCKGDSDDAPETRSNGTQAMTERLKRFSDDVDLKKSPWANARRAEALSWRPLPPSDSQQGLLMRSLLAYELLWAGRTEEAIERFQEIERLFLKYEVGPQSLRQVRDGLASAFLRLAEQENCVSHHSVDSCLMPIRGSGVHAVKTGSRNAVRVLSETLRRYPDDLGLHWLLNLAYMTLGEYPEKVPAQWLIPPSVFDSQHEIPRYFDIAPQVGLDHVSLAGGSIMEDFDKDGYLDIMVSSWGLTDQMRFFHNDGNGSFTDRTAEAGLLGEISGLNMSHADYNNDGFPDVLVLRGGWLGEQGLHPNSLLRNNGDGTFDDVTEACGLLSFHPTQVGVWADYDNDGWIDLFIGNESLPQSPHPCQLFHNNGDGTFSDVAAAVGVASVGYVKGAARGDYNNDDLPDLYLSIFNEPNILYRNEGPDSSGRWRFSDVSRKAGVTDPDRCFPTWFWDYNNDGWLDLFVASFEGFDEYTLPAVAADFLGKPTGKMSSRLYRNNKDGTFTDVTKEARLDPVLLAMGANYGDIDNDGYLDCYFGTGEPDLRTLVPNRMFRNAGGLFFEEVTTSGGFGHLQKGHGISFGDIDNDGDQDIYAVMGGAYSGDVYQNVLFSNPGNANHWISIELEGTRSNRAAIGARVEITVREADGGQRDIHATVSSGGSFGSSPFRQHVGLGTAGGIETLEVRWPASGLVQSFRDVKMDQFIRIREGDASPTTIDRKRIVFPSPKSAAAHEHKH
ncbi:MAG: CRTAC1 family protein [Planctomycetes bacterium]|nr:CRTAC1 family protein [Planctomycetota bacterium]